MRIAKNLCGKPVWVKILKKKLHCRRDKYHTGLCSPDLTGESFGYFVALKPGHHRLRPGGAKTSTWWVKNTTNGEIKTVVTQFLLDGTAKGERGIPVYDSGGKIKRCGKLIWIRKLNKNLPCMNILNHWGGMHTPNLIGQEFGNLIVIKLGVPSKNPRGIKSTVWQVKNKISGEIRSIKATRLVSGEITGRHPFSNRYRINGKKRPEYNTVASHYRQIFNPKANQHKNYKGMPFADEWNPNKGGSFYAGADWIIKNLGLKPNQDASCHIIDHEKGFVPGNIEWASRFKQNSEQMFKIIARQKHRISKLEKIILQLKTA